MSLILALSIAHGADVVWLSPPDDATRATVLAAAGGSELDPIELRASASDVTDEDEAVLKGLAVALETVRPYEQQLDGELLIMRDLQRPISQVTLLRDDSDRTALFAALAYQGFAVDRFFGEDLGTDEQAAPYRADFAGIPVPTPWRDAVAIEPDRKIDAYDIAEAPQRVRYSEVQQLVKEQLPASLVPSDLPRGSQLRVDGRPVTPDATGSVKVSPGRHLVHVAHGEHVLQRWELVLEPGGQADLAVELTDAVWNGFVSSLSVGATVPDALKPSLEVQGEVWLARPGPKRPEVFAIDATGAVRSVELDMASTRSPEGGGGRPGIQVGLLGGWTGSQDFYYQDPRVPATAGTVNAATLGATVGLDVPIAILRVGVGVDGMLPLGTDHAAVTGDSAMRLRPVPHVAVGLRQASVAVGYAFPYHPAVGLRGSQGIVGPLELRWLGWFGLPTTSSRDGAADYTTRSLGMAAAGVGLRL